jgi:outer membrane protein assembly factor BamB
VPSEWSGKNLTLGADGNLYLGTAPHAHLLRLETATGEFTDLGRPAAGETFLWSTTLGADHKIYGGTYPSARLIRYDPSTGSSEDLGRMDPVEMYARFVVGSSDGFIYIGIGYGTAHLVAYEIATGNHRDILPAAYQLGGSATYVYAGTDGRI